MSSLMICCEGVVDFACVFMCLSTCEQVLKLHALVPSCFLLMCTPRYFLDSHSTCILLMCTPCVRVNDCLRISSRKYTALPRTSVPLIHDSMQWNFVHVDAFLLPLFRLMHVDIVCVVCFIFIVGHSPCKGDLIFIVCALHEKLSILMHAYQFTIICVLC